MSNAIEIRGLVKRYPRFTLGPLDLTVPQGAIYGLIGPNGSGKTTTIDLIFRMGATDGGSISVMGLNHARDEAAVKGQVGYASPDLVMKPWRTVGNAIKFVRGFRPTWDDSECERLMRAFDLKPKQPIESLSFGGAIKLSLLTALAWRPRVLILDEPTIGLDAIVKQEIFAELLSAVHDGERTVFISSHGLTDLERFADHVGMLKQGRLLVEGPVSDVVERYRMVDVRGRDSQSVGDLPGVVVQEHRDGLWRALVDVKTTALASFAARRLEVVSDAPVTLEELFVALGRN